MTNYKQMYFIVCAAASEAIEAMQRKETNKAEDVLFSALHYAEEVYIDSSSSTYVSDMLRRVWERIRAAGPYILCGVILLALMVCAFFVGGMVGLHGWFMQT